MSAAVKLQDDARPAVGLLVRAFDEAIAWHTSRLVMTDDEVDQLMANARNQAFWIGNPEMHESRYRLLELSAAHPRRLTAWPIRWRRMLELKTPSPTGCQEPLGSIEPLSALC